jgi:hypothetical protein
MWHRSSLTATFLVLTCTLALAKDKKKTLLPADILKAHTVYVMIDPMAGVDVQEPTVNNDARRDVENAFVKWGRLDPVQDRSLADLIVVVRKGHSRFVEPTISGTPINNPPMVTGENSPTRTSVAGRTGNPGYPGDASNGQAPSSRPYPQTEVGPTQDMFVVYRATPSQPSDNPLDRPPVWRFNAKDALEAPEVPAVVAFQKLVDESDKQLAAHP